MIRLRHGATLVRGTGFPPDRQGLTEGDLPFFKVGDFNRSGNETYLSACDNWISQATALELRARPVPADTVLFPKIGAALLLGARRITTRPSVFDNNVLGVVPITLDPRYLRYWLSTVDLAPLANPGPVPSLDDDALRDLHVPVTVLDEQRAIADYLDAETARLDYVIAAIRESLQLIAEYRKSLITEVFVEPAHTRRRSTVRALADVLLGRQRSPEQADGPHMVPYLRAANVKDGRLDLDDVMEMNFNPREQRTFALVSGDVLVTEGAGSLAAVGANAIWNGDVPGVICFQNTLIRLRPKDGSDPRFVGWWARYAFESGLLASVAGGANIYHLGVETVRTLPAWAPPLSVQRQAADRLDREMASLERQVAVRRSQVDLLLERRQALITAAVTGLLEIPGVAA